VVGSTPDGFVKTPVCGSREAAKNAKKGELRDSREAAKAQSLREMMNGIVLTSTSSLAPMISAAQAMP
jgi:hypothetical protein